MVTLLNYGDQYNSIPLKLNCLSTDTKPTSGLINGVALSNGSIIYEIDTGKSYVFDVTGGSWNEAPSVGGSGGGSSANIINAYSNGISQVSTFSNTTQSYQYTGNSFFSSVSSNT
jgi:hypothetical protein